LVQAARAYGYADRIVADIPRRCYTVSADLHQPLGNAARQVLRHRVDQVWHCAGSLRYHRRDRDLIHRTNVEGTARLLGLAGDIGASAFHYISSAYVAGTTDGLIPERRANLARARNAYEESKIRAEELVLSTNRFRTTVLRPSVVIGHSRTAAVSGSLSGIYGLAFSLGRHARHHSGSGGIRLHMDRTATANLVPVDQVAAEAVACGLAGRHNEIFHIVGEPTVEVPVLIEQICRTLDLGAVTFVDHADDLREADRRLADRMAYYLSYMWGDKVFDRTNTNRVVGPAAAAFAGRPTLEEALGWYARAYPVADAVAVGTGA
jgi:nucleoside-diphosphate-sugar epimerase